MGVGAGSLTMSIARNFWMTRELRRAMGRA